MSQFSIFSAARPVQNIGSSFGFAYLFGFGANSVSYFGISLAFSLMLVFNGLIFSSFLMKGENSELSRKA